MRDLGSLRPEAGRRLREFRQPEVQYLHRAIGQDLHICRFQIPVDDAPFVRRLERLRDLSGDWQGLVQRQRTFGNTVGQRRPFDEFQHERTFLDPVDLRNVGMIERGKQLGFTLKPRQPFRIVRERIGQDLDRDVALQPRITRAIHLAHPARADGGQDLVGANSNAGH